MSRNSHAIKNISDWTTSVDDLVKIFRDALVAVAPVLERAKIDHMEGDAYDDWDNVAEALFDSVVRKSIEWSAEAGHDVTLSRYGNLLPSYVERPYIVVRDQDRPKERFIFHEIRSAAVHFDSVRALSEDHPQDPPIEIPWPRASFSLRLPGRQDEVTTLSVDL